MEFDRLTRLRRKIMFGVDEKPMLWRINFPIQWLLCHLVRHTPVSDMCNIPEHDYCLWCGEIMPFAARNNDVIA